jgi:hypothetical protein
MRKFSDFADDPYILDGEKIRIDDVLNQELTVLGFSVKGSKFSKNKSGNYLTLQVQIKNEKRIVFTGSDVLIGQLEKYREHLPFEATVKKVDRFYTLS